MAANASALVDGRGYTIQELFVGRQYRLEYFQRDYVWGREQVAKLLEDLSGRFLAQWSESHERRRVRRYEGYFLGPFVSYRADGVSYLTDGQQRFTTLLVLLIYLRRLLLDQEDPRTAAAVDRLICTDMYDELSFTVDVPDYAPCIEAMYQGKSFLTDGQLPAVQQLWRCYNDLPDVFPHDLRGEALPFFTEWLLTRVALVEITAGGPERGWEIFQSMNDRGLRLTPLDLLRGYLLSKADRDHDGLRTAWQRMVGSLALFGETAPTDFVRSVLLSKYAELDGDVGDRHDIEQGLHEWVRRNADRIWPDRKEGDTRRFITDMLVPLSKSYTRLLSATKRPLHGLEPIFFNAVNGLTDQSQLSLSAMHPDDPEPVFEQKARMIGAFLDLLLIRRMVNNRPAQQADVDPIIQRLLPGARKAATLHELRAVLAAEVALIEDDFTGLETLRLKDNRRFVHYLLARLTAWLEIGSGRSTPIREYFHQGPTGPAYQIEHLWPNTFKRYEDVAKTPENFQLMRNRIGGLILLPAEDNASVGAATFDRKLEWYRGQNLLAASLHPATYERGAVKFKKFIKQEGLGELFRHYEGGFGPAIEERGKLYRAMAERIWDPRRLDLVVSADSDAVRIAPVAPAKARGKRANYRVEFRRLVQTGLIPIGVVLVGQHRGRTYRATVLADGRIRTETGEAFESPSAAAMDVLNRQSWNGWTFWHLERGGMPIRIDRIRAEALERGLLEDVDAV